MLFLIVGASLLLNGCTPVQQSSASIENIILTKDSRLIIDNKMTDKSSCPIDLYLNGEKVLNNGTNYNYDIDSGTYLLELKCGSNDRSIYLESNVVIEKGVVFTTTIKGPSNNNTISYDIISLP